MTSLKLTVLISGNGSNLQAIIDAINHGTLDAKVVSVISDNPDAFGLKRAEKTGIPTYSFPYNTRHEFEEQLLKQLQRDNPNYIVLAGFMRILSKNVIEPYYGQILNIHPSLLPKFRGLNTHERAIEAKETEHGATIHVVSEKLDDGPIISQAKLKILPTDTAETLKKRIQILEHKLYPQTLQMLMQQKPR